ncbi:MAG: TetR/AcrR family transcriptional regulator [Polyangiales bacterium]
MYRDAIVDAAERLFAAQGYEATKIQDIAKDAGISLGTLYSVFDGKASILDGVHQHRLSELFSLVGPDLAGSLSASERLLLGNRVFVKWLVSHRNYLSIHLQNNVGWGSSPHGVGADLEGAWDRGVRLMATVIEQGMCEGALYQSDPIVAARIMVSIQQVLISAWIESGTKQDPDDVCDEIEELIVRALFRRDDERKR